MPLLAHVDRETDREQTLRAHSRNVGRMCAASCRRAGLERLGELAGLLHDSGKATELFQNYLKSGDRSLRGKINHSSCGARILEECCGFGTDVRGLAAILIATAVCGHHSGLPDVLSPRGEDVLGGRIRPERETFYDEASSRFSADCLPCARQKELFEEAAREALNLVNRLKRMCAPMPKRQQTQLQFCIGLAERFLYSALIDADRYDAYLFEAGQEEPEGIDRRALWPRLLDRLEQHLDKLGRGGHGNPELLRVRGEISNACRDAASRGPGVYQLYVPTGGGKTLGSLRFGLHAAARGNLRHLYYIAPYKTILEQNAKDIRAVLREDSAVLEHHSDVVFDGDGGEELRRYELLTQRWDESPIILTTMVQFLQTLFSGRSACARRFHALAESVIVLDEVQATPVKFVSMLNAALNFLVHVCGCTVVLCTATQPDLAGVAVPVKLAEQPQMVPERLTGHPSFRRTRLVDLSMRPPFTAKELAEFAARKQQDGSVLAVLNTKTAARRLYTEVCELLPESSVYLLTTAFCPAHRIKLLDEIRARLDSKEVIVVISTQLIEAGVDISFGCVIRSLAGLESIAQAAGRCNRHGEGEVCEVYIVRCADETLKFLPDIRKGQSAAQIVLEEFRRNPESLGNDLLSPQAIQRYYQIYYHEREIELDYPVPKGGELPQDDTLLSLLSVNESALKSGKPLPKRMLRQAFSTAGGLVEVIGKNGVDAIVPYGEGAGLIEQLLSERTPLGELPGLLRQAQRYTVHLFEYEARELGGALYPAQSCGALMLADGFYDNRFGVKIRGAAPELMAN